MLCLTICVDDRFIVDARFFAPLPNLLSSITQQTFKVCHFLRVLMRDGGVRKVSVVHNGLCEYGCSACVHFLFCKNILFISALIL